MKMFFITKLSAEKLGNKTIRCDAERSCELLFAHSMMLYSVLVLGF